MNTRQKEIRDRIAKRRKMQEQKKGSWAVTYKKEEDGFHGTASYEIPPETDHPLFRKEVFYFKILASIVLFLMVAIMFRIPVPRFEEARNLVSHYMKKEFEFAAAKDWYQDTFGKPLVFIPSDKEPEVTAKKGNEEFAQPAAGKISESFQANGQGLMIETDKESPVESTKEGVIIFTGKKDKLGNTVVIQHSDKSESWYGHLGSIDVSLYETVKKGKIIGKVSNTEDGAKGTFYLAIKKGSQFVDPKQVIEFE
ncbi:stage IV sporulation protein FA [Peribacillus deserti]|uniref:Stage IV sporulation protein FA n=1 Tax=Peribacillus deserti TaxID=673318 RepID=A0ABS2QFP8_9BACI|nr:M23 family metallopeptidase [Peribacillus deserti]MBM7691917.1 stage IV sporulation protein FA [Peribacillus deserti]